MITGFKVYCRMLFKMYAGSTVLAHKPGQAGKLLWKNTMFYVITFQNIPPLASYTCNSTRSQKETAQMSGPKFKGNGNIFFFNFKIKLTL
jgi:hypothetical protein